MNRIKLFVMSVSLLLSACSTTPQTLPRKGLADTGHPALHAVMDERLNKEMNRMNALFFDRFTTQPELDRERRKYALEIAQTARRLNAAVDYIRGRMPTLNLTESEQGIFIALANKLSDQAKTLQVQAENNEIDALPETLEHITSTCNSCHGLFRKHVH